MDTVMVETINGLKYVRLLDVQDLILQHERRVDGIMDSHHKIVDILLKEIRELKDKYDNTRNI